jgi:nucleoside-diphosphate-sugar epimerase
MARNFANSYKGEYVMKRIVVTGGDGYLGWPVCLRLLEQGHKVMSIDNGLRRDMVHEIGGDSGIPIASINERYLYGAMNYTGRFEYHHFDLSDTNITAQVLQALKPDTVIHLASQPSAPYSHVDAFNAVFTQQNNITMLLNILWVLHEHKINSHLIVTTTTGIYGQPDFEIPEGWLQPYEMKLPFPNMAGSFYHMSRGFDAGNLLLASKHFNYPITELRTSIIGGSSTEETRANDTVANRFDFDYYFGVVTNRFVAQALMGKPITIYGKGEQQRPIISLEDACESTVNAVTLRERLPETEKYAIFNQTQGTISPVEMATTVKETLEGDYDIPVEVKHLPNPRVENEEAQMRMRNDRFVSDLVPDGFKIGLKESIAQICHDTQPFRDRIQEIGKDYK